MNVKEIVQKMDLATIELSTLPDGNLVIHKQKYGGHQYIDPKTKKRREKYIPIAELDHWKQLFQRRKELKEIIKDCKKLLKGHAKEVKEIRKQQEAWKKVKNHTHKEEYMHYTLGGEYVRSKSELVIANYCYLNHIQYEYEKPIRIGRDIYHPDFTIYNEGKVIYLEHLGLLENDNYRRKWERKKENYDKHGIREGENLICTREYNGRMDMREIHQIMRDWNLVK